METERLVLRQWRDEDRARFAAMNADPEVMAFFPRLHSSEESDALLDRLRAGITDRGYGFWAVELRDSGCLIGFAGLSEVRGDYHFTPAHEVGWRLAREHWGHGYATEAGAAALAFGFGELGLDEIVAFAVAANARSRRVMERLGMSYDPVDDFEHVAFPKGHPYRRHV
ncbi:MAG: GNAT family N-acetyltransferase, partial [Actinomycetota bacterium]|nr:GNAT family N-acetyltransferase [Actinomycetota bacterium]